MFRRIAFAALALVLCLTVSVAQGEQGRGRSSGGGQGARKPAAKQPSRPSGQKAAGGPQGARSSNPSAATPPGGAWSDRTHSGKQSAGQPGNQPEGSAAAGAAAANRKQPQASGADGAAAGAAAANRNEPPASGAEGAAAGAAAADRNQPQASGAEGAAAGAAVANRNSPTVSGAEGAAAGAAVANRNAPAVSGADGAAAGYAAVRNSFNDANIYGQQWYGSHPDVWAASGWAAGAAWTPSTWDAVAVQCGYANSTPTSYNYGVNVTSEDGNVSVDGQNVGTVEAFSQQAADLADSGAEATTADSDEWLPLGVFAMVRNEQQHPQLIVQLAINKQGILRGNYTDEVTEHTLPIQGAVDKTTQRAAWRVGHNQQAVMEAGLNDLTEAEAPALIHKNGKTDHWLLVRLEQPQQAASDGANAKSQ